MRLGKGKFLAERELFLDERDKKIIDLLRKDSRIPYSKIGRITKISKDQVRERVKKLRDSKVIIDFLTIIDYSVIGYNLYHAFIKLQPFPIEKEEIFSKSASCPNIASFGMLIGRYDLEYQIIAKDKTEATNILEEIFGNIDSEKKEILVKKEMEDHIIAPSSQLTDKSKRTSERLDHIDGKILSELSNNARLTFVEIAHRVGKTEDVVRHRFNKLKSSGLILGFRTRINQHRQKKSSHIFLLKLKKPLTEELKRKLRELENIYAITECSDRQDVFLDFYTEDTKGLRKTRDFVIGCLDDYMGELNFMTLLAQYKVKPFSQDINLPRKTLKQ